MRFFRHPFVKGDLQPALRDGSVLEAGFPRVSLRCTLGYFHLSLREGLPQKGKFSPGKIAKRPSPTLPDRSCPISPAHSQRSRRECRRIAQDEAQRNPGLPYQPKSLRPGGPV